MFSRFGSTLFLASILVIGLSPTTGCKKSESNKESKTAAGDLSNRDVDAANGENGSEVSEETSTEDQSILQRTGGMLRQATDSSVKAAGNAGNWIKDKVQDTYEGGKAATVNAGNAIRNMFQQAKEAGTTTANNVVDFVKEDFAKLGSFQYASRTVTNEKPDQIVTMLNQMGAEKWECFWVDKRESETTLYFKKTPRSYVNSIPFKDMIRYLPELGAGNE